jgi:diamine N-acetyltransferase
MRNPENTSAVPQFLSLSSAFDPQIITLVQLLEPALTVQILQARISAMRSQGAEFIGLFEESLLGIAAISMRTHCFSGRTAYVENVVFDPEARQRGLGERLMEWLEQYAKSQQCSMITLDAYQRNTRARTFYERLGYDPRGVHFVKSL